MRAGGSNPGSMPVARKRPTGKAFGCDRASAIPEMDGRVGSQSLLSVGEEQEGQQGAEGREGGTPEGCG